jgi:ligand-binding sensor domain-containing protein
MYALPNVPSTSGLFLVLILLTACFGAADHPTRESSATDPVSPVRDTLPPGSSLSTAGDMSHLFYREDQLCAWVRQAFQDSRGDLWFGTNHYGVMRYAGDSLTYHTDTEGLAAGRITGIVEDATGNVWFGTQRGLTKYDGTTSTNYAEEDGLTNSEIWSLLLDREGIFWIGTSEGIFQFDGATFMRFLVPKVAVKDTNTILSYDRITSLVEDKNGAIWFGTDGFGVGRYDGTGFQRFTRADGLPDNNVADLLEDRHGNIWIGTMFGGVSRYDGHSFTNFTQDGAVSGSEVYGLYATPDGAVWFSAEGHGIYRYDGSDFTLFNQEQGLDSQGIQCFLTDREGRFWLGGWGGLFRKDGNAFFPVTRNGPWT